jgi:hypothetical protein
MKRALANDGLTNKLPGRLLIAGFFEFFFGETPHRCQASRLDLHHIPETKGVTNRLFVHKPFVSSIWRRGTGTHHYLTPLLELRQPSAISPGKVIFSSLNRVRQDSVRLIYLLHLSVGFLDLLAPVRMALESHPAIRLFYLFGTGIGRNTQDLVVVSVTLGSTRKQFHHGLLYGCHWDSQ